MSDATMSIPLEMATEGVIGAVQPTREHLGDIEFGWPLLEQLVEMQIGHAIAVRERDVIAVEVSEGTASMIERAGELCRRIGWSLLDTAPADDPEACVVTVERIGQLAAAGGRCLAVGAGAVAFVDKTAVIRAADRTRIAIVGVGQRGSVIGCQGSP